MPKGRRKKIKVPTDSQPQFELGNTSEDIKRRRERQERKERERQEQEERDREVAKREDRKDLADGRD